jgi:vancomycin resistance protein YoaR
MPHRLPQARRRWPIAVAVGAVVVVLAGGYLLLHQYSSAHVARGTTVEGVAIGGLTPAAAERELVERLGPVAAAPLEVTVESHAATVAPAEAGLRFDAPATVAAALGNRSADPFSLVRSFFGSRQVSPVVAVDEPKLAATVAQLATKVDGRAQDGSISFAGGKVSVTEPRAGVALDQKLAATRLSSSLFVPSRKVTLTAGPAQPRVTSAEVSRAVESFAKPAMSGPVQVKVGEKSFAVTPAELASALTMPADGKGTLTPRLDGTKLQAGLKERLASVAVAPVDATVRLSGGKPVVVPAKVGHTVSPDALSAAVLAVLPKSGEQRVAVVRTVPKQPKVTTAAVQKLGIKEVVGEFTTRYPHAAYRNINLGRAAELINGTLLMPGDTFSLNKVVGKRTRARGFVDGFVIEGGRLREGVGGGVSQMATTSYNAGFFAGFEDVEHHQHHFYISRYPVGREATVYWPRLDMRFRNNTPYGALVEAVRVKSAPGKRGSVTVRIWSTKYWTVKTETSDRYDQTSPERIYDTEPGCVDQEGVNGFEVDVKRWVYLNGDLKKSENDHVEYDPEDNIICGPAPSPTPTPGPSGGPPE